MGVADKAAPLLDARVIVAPVKGVQVDAPGKAKLETHLRVAHGIAALFAVMTDRERRKTTRAGLVRCFDDQRHVRRVLDVKVKAVVPTSGFLQNLQNGLHAATS